MRSKSSHTKCVVIAIALLASSVPVLSDDTFDKLISSGKYKDALDYADNNISAGDRTAAIWIKLGQANDALGLNEKALACYLVSWRLNPDDYQSILGAAKVYNNLGQPDNAIDMAKKALDKKFTAEASWEYAKACIALNRAPEAKQALQKVIESDPSNAVANRELGNIYYNDKDWKQAVPLLKKTYSQKKDAELAYKIGKALVESGSPDQGIDYLKEAIAGNCTEDASVDLARAYFDQKNYKEAQTAYGKADKNDLSASDLYNLAFSKEKNGEDATGAYGDAVEKFGSSTENDALLAREKAGRGQLKSNDFQGALGNFQFIVNADERGVVVPEIYFLLAEAQQGIGDGQRAISSLEKAISLNGKNVEAYARLADLYQKNGMADKAKKTFETLMSLSPNDPNVYLALGQYNNKSGKYADALTQLQKSDKLRHCAQASEGIAVAAFNLNDYNQARDAAKAAIGLDPGSWDARLVLAKVLINDKDFRGAQEQLEYIVQKEPFNNEYLKQLASCYEQNGNNDKLAEIDKKIAASDRTNVESRLRLAAYAEGHGDLQTALNTYNELASLTPKEPDIFKKLYETSAKMGDTSSAVSNLKRYIELVPGDAEAQKNLGDCLYNKKDYDGALSAYRTAMKLDPTIKGFYKRYAEIVIAKGQQDEVISVLTGVINNGEADLGTYTTLGMIYQKKKMYVKAIDMYQKALMKEPSNFDALVALASCQAASGSLDQAVISYEQAVMMNGQATTELRDLGDLYLRLKRTDEAVLTFKKYLDKVPTDAGVAVIVGKNAYNNKQYDMAVKYLAVASGKTNDENIILMYGTACLNTEKYGEAVGAFERLRAMKLKALMPTVLKSLAESYEKSGKDLEAAKAYEEYASLGGVKDPDASYKQAFLQEKSNPLFAEKTYDLNVRLYPSDYRNYLRLGLIYSAKKETLPKAITTLRRVTELADSVPTVWLDLAQVYGKMGRREDELNAYRKYTESDSRNFEANKRIGAILMEKGETTDALVYLEMANTVKPDDPDVMEQLAIGYVKTGRSEEAINMLVKAKDSKKDDLDIRYQLFSLYRKTGKKDDALKEIKALIDLKHDNKYLILYAQALIEGDQLKEAEDAIEDILATVPDNIDALMLKAKVQKERKKYDDAIETFKEIATINPNYAPALCERAEVHLLQSKPQWAETFFKRALQADPNYALAELGLAKVCKLHKDTTGYEAHMETAQKMDPDNDQIKEELQRGSK